MSDASTAVKDSASPPPDSLSDSQPAPPLWYSVAVPAIAMSLGWGLRGQYGGPRGAMVPGALVALALVLTSRRRLAPRDVWLIAAAGSLGFAVGGEETYMQTVSLTGHSSTMLWGFLGILLKGGFWGGFGGLLVGSALSGRRYSPTGLLLPLNVAIALSFVAYWLFNAHHQIYFSGGGGRPRAEGWAGLWTIYLVLLCFAARARDWGAVLLSLWGAAGCAGGFVLGVLAFRLGDHYLGAQTAGFMDWWKVAECGFGLIGGAMLGFGWHRIQGGTVATVAAHSAGVDPGAGAPAESKGPSALMLALLAVDLLLFFQVADAMGDLPGWIGKAPFAFVVPVFLLLLPRHRLLALGVGVASPIAETMRNVQSYWVDEHHVLALAPSVVGLILLAALAGAAAAIASRSPRRLLLLVAWATTACAWLKMGIPPPGSWPVYLLVQGIFTLMAAWLTMATLGRTGRDAVAG